MNEYNVINTSQKKSDWNANDGEAGYIKNRTHYIETGNSITGTFTLTQEDIEQEEIEIQNSPIAEEIFNIFKNEMNLNTDIILNNKTYNVNISAYSDFISIAAEDMSFGLECYEEESEEEEGEIIYQFVIYNASPNIFIVGENTLAIPYDIFHTIDARYIEDTLLWQRGSGNQSVKTKNCTASGEASHAEGDGTTASGLNSHAEGSGTTASGNSSHTEGYNAKAIGDHSHAEGGSTTASGHKSHAEGQGTTASGGDSHAEGYQSKAIGDYSHAEGWDTTASGHSSHAEGTQTTASEYCSHAEGSNTTASGNSSHAEGYNTTASGVKSHTEGNETTASGDHSHAEGDRTIANHENQHVFGAFNIEDPSSASSAVKGTYIEIVGNGFNSDTRSNARTLDWHGNEWLAGKMTADFGIVLKSPDGSSYTLTMNNDGTLKITKNT